MRLTIIALVINALWPRMAMHRDAVWWEARQRAIRERRGM